MNNQIENFNETIDSMVFLSIEEYFNTSFKPKLDKIYSKYGEVIVVLRNYRNRYSQNRYKQYQFTNEKVIGIKGSYLSIDFTFGKICLASRNCWPKGEEIEKKTLVVKYVAKGDFYNDFNPIVTNLLCECSLEKGVHTNLIRKGGDVVRASCGGIKTMVELLGLLKAM